MLEVKELVEYLNSIKILIREYKELIKVLNKNIETLPLFSFREKKVKEKTLINIRENDICIFALMNMIDHAKGKKLDEKQLIELEEGINVFLLDTKTVKNIIMILNLYNREVDINLKDYINSFYKKQIDTWKMYTGDKKEVVRFLEKQKRELECLEIKQFTMKYNN